MDDFIPSIKVTFYIVGDEFDFDEVTSRIGVHPTSTRKKAEFPPQSIAAGVAQTIWAMEVKEEHCIAICFLFERLLNVLAPKKNLITSVCEDYNLEASFEVIIHMKDGDSPEVVLPREVIAFAASINAEISFDLYCYE